MESTAQSSSQTPSELPQDSLPKRFSFQKIVTILMGLFIIIVLVISWMNGTKTRNTKVSQESASISAAPSVSAIPSEVQSLADEALQKLGTVIDLTQLPLGDKKYTTTGPKKGYIYLCRTMSGGGGAQGPAPWINGMTWNKNAKPSVQGSVSWSAASYSQTASGSTRIITGNNLPVNATTGTFPIKASDPAYRYDRNPNTISAHSYTLKLPTNPIIASSPGCMGGEVGVMINGVPLFNGFDADNRDAAAHEVQDSCDGHPEKTGEYHYHSLSRCLKDIKVTTVIGYALDGFPVTGPVLPNNTKLTTEGLDECHGITSRIVLDGKNVSMYHYVLTDDFPYSVSCFKGKPVQMQIISNLKGIQQTQDGSMTRDREDRDDDERRQPPQEAFTACSTKSQGATCSVTTLRGVVSGTCRQTEDQESLVCVPSNPQR